MTPLRQTYRVAGAPLLVSGDGFRQSGWQEEFRYPDGALPASSGWTDASVQYPTMFDPVTVTSSNHKLNAMPTHTRVDAPVAVAGHHLIYRDIGVSDNFEVGCTWYVDDDERIIGQIMPAIFVDPNAASVYEMGLGMTYDISLGTMYVQNVFRQTPITNVMQSIRTVTDLQTFSLAPIVSDNANFTTYDVGLRVSGTNIPANTTISVYNTENAVTLSQSATGTGTGGTLNIHGYYDVLSPFNTAQGGHLSFAGSTYVQQTVFGGRNTLALRVQGGTITMVHNGRTLAAPSVPSWATGRTLAGMQIISTKNDVGNPRLGGGTVASVIPELIDNWYWRPL